MQKKTQLSKIKLRTAAYINIERATASRKTGAMKVSFFMQIYQIFGILTEQICYLCVTYTHRDACICVDFSIICWEIGLQFMLCCEYCEAHLMLMKHY